MKQRYSPTTDAERIRPSIPPEILAVLAFTFSVLVIGIFAVHTIAEVRARKWILRELNALPSKYEVIVNGRQVDDGALIIESLRRLRHFHAHHSSPMAPILLQINHNSATTELIISRDSERPDEYWVFRPGRNLQGDPRGQEAGRIVDRQLTEYLRRRGF